ncbi:hypothetical protein Hanom_Chr15g01363171 [Helianthus anomalus]
MEFNTLWSVRRHFVGQLFDYYCLLYLLHSSHLMFSYIHHKHTHIHMASFMPFSNKNLDIFMCALRPTVAIVDDLLDTLKHFSLFTETLGCIHSSIFKSIHGNLVPLSL